MRKLWLAVAAGVLICGCTACTDPNVTGSYLDSKPPAPSAAAPSSSAEPAEELVFTTPIPQAEASNFVDIEIATPVPVLTATPGPSQSFNYAYSDRIKVHYYDMETQQAMSTQYPVSDKSDPNVVLDGVQEAYKEILGGQSIRINEATFSGGNLFVDFDPSIYSLNLGSAGERQVLESIADTYLTNVNGIEAVYYTVDGKPYSSDNISLGENESYKTVLG